MEKVGKHIDQKGSTAQLHDPQVVREAFVVTVHFGQVSKFDLRRQLGCRTDYEWRKTINYLMKDEDFKDAYSPFSRTWGIPENIAIQIIKHLLPCHVIHVKLATSNTE